MWAAGSLQPPLSTASLGTSVFSNLERAVPGNHRAAKLLLSAFRDAGELPSV